jgi:hypothetical protein
MHSTLGLKAFLFRNAQSTNSRSICSKVLPLVSGNLKNINKNPARQMAA